MLYVISKMSTNNSKNALEPVISAEIMQLHHSKHHQTYVTNYNTAEEKLQKALSSGDLQNQISLHNALKFNGGGHVNHSIFWRNLKPIKEGGGDSPKGALNKQILKDFGSLENLIQQFNAKTAAVQGSGWGWLGFDPISKDLEIATTTNQDPLRASAGLIPLLGVDVWEHAYYLQYKNARPAYLKEIWKIINWENVLERYTEAAEMCNNR